MAEGEKTSSATSTVGRRFVIPIGLGVFILLFSFLTITSFLQESPTFDEPVHLFAGYSYLKWGDFRANPEHPPLVKVLAALPLLLFDLKDPRPSSPDWDRIPEFTPGSPAENVAQNMVFGSNSADSLFLYAKLPMVGLGIILGIFVYLWGKDLYGPKAACAAIFIYCLDPNILAHSRLIHTDIPFAAFFFISSYFFWRSLTQFNWANAFFASLFFGLAAITKHSFPVIFLIWAILGLLWIVSSRPQQYGRVTPRALSGPREKVAILGAILLCALVAAYLFIWASYGFRFQAIPDVNHPFRLDRAMPDNPLLQTWGHFINKHHLFPEAWIHGQLLVLKWLRRAAYLLGEVSDSGFWFYFPVAFAVKTPLPTLILLLGMTGIWAFRPRERITGMFLLIPVVVYFSLAVWSRMNIGLRHLLPIYPFLFVLMGGTVTELWKGDSRIKKGVLIILAVWYLWSAARIYPHYLAYFNELTGGPKNGYQVLLDSNLDWGQELKGLKRWMDNGGVKKIQFLYFGKADPRYYGIDAFYLPGSFIISPPQKTADSKFELPDHLAVSATLRYGGKLYLSQEQQKILQSYRLKEPIAAIGHSILVYRLDLADPQVHYNVGFILARQGRLDIAADRLRQALRIRPDFAEAHFELGNLLSREAKLEEATRHYKEAVRIDPSSAGTHHNLAIALAEQGNLTEAIQHFRKAIEFSSSNAGIYFNWGTAMSKGGRFDEAIDLFQKSLAINPNFVEAYHNLGAVMAAKGDFEQAVDHFRRALQIDPAHVNTHFNMANILARQGSLPDAVEHFQAALKVKPDFVEAHERLGQVLAQQGKRKEAKKHYEEALRIVKSRRQGSALR